MPKLNGKDLAMTLSQNLNLIEPEEVLNVIDRNEISHKCIEQIREDPENLSGSLDKNFANW